MKRPLVVTDSSDAVIELIQEAGEQAANADVPLMVLTVVTDEEYQNDIEVMETIHSQEGATTERGPATYAKNVAQSAITDILSDLDIETEAIGKHVSDEGDRADAILETAENRDADYIFLLGKRRSPTGKAIFGDTAQSVILNFDNFVVTTAE